MARLQSRVALIMEGVVILWRFYRGVCGDLRWMGFFSTIHTIIYRIKLTLLSELAPLQRRMLEKNVLIEKHSSICWLSMTESSGSSDIS